MRPALADNGRKGSTVGTLTIEYARRVSRGAQPVSLVTKILLIQVITLTTDNNGNTSASATSSTAGMPTAEDKAYALAAVKLVNESFTLGAMPVNVWLAQHMASGIPVGFLADAIRAANPSLSGADDSLLSITTALLSGQPLTEEQLKAMRSDVSAAAKEVKEESDGFLSAAQREAFIKACVKGGKIYEFWREIREEFGIKEDTAVHMGSAKTCHDITSKIERSTDYFGGLIAGTVFFNSKADSKRIDWSTAAERDALLNYAGVQAEGKTNRMQALKAAIENAMLRVGVEGLNKLRNGQPVDGITQYDARVLGITYKEPDATQEFLWHWLWSGSTAGHGNIDSRYSLGSLFNSK
mgnify:FL=1